MDFDSYTMTWLPLVCWFAENLRTSVFQDGTDIPEEASAAEFPNIVTPARTTYNGSQTMLNIHGHLTMDMPQNHRTRRHLSTSWHVPTEVDWQTLKPSSCTTATENVWEMH